MRNENLKNKLNNLPQEIDSEQIWSAIDLPKKKRKRRGIFWFFGASLLIGVLLFATIYIGSHNFQNHNSENKPHSELTKSSKITIAEDHPEIVTDNDISGNKNSSPKNSENNNIAGSTEKSLSESDLKNKVTSLKSHSVSVSRNLDRREINTGSTNSPYLRSRKKAVEGKNYEINAVQDGIALSKLSTNKEELELIKTIQSLEPIAFQPLEIAKMDLELDINFSIHKSYHDKPFYYGISFFSLLGKSIHDFQHSSIRQLEEKGLESISVGIIGHKHLGNFELFSGISYTRHNTQLTTSAQDLLTVNSIQGLIQREVNTQYELYNSYQYVDINFGMGYSIHLTEKWSLTPSAQIGYSLNFDPSGEILNHDNQLIELSGMREYMDYSRWQGQANIKISRSISENWSVGLSAFLTTKKSIGKLDVSSHEVSSSGLGLWISRFFE